MTGVVRGEELGLLGLGHSSHETATVRLSWDGGKQGNGLVGADEEEKFLALAQIGGVLPQRTHLRPRRVPVAGWLLLEELQGLGDRSEGDDRTLELREHQERVDLGDTLAQ